MPDLCFVISRSEKVNSRHKSEIYSHIAKTTQSRRRARNRRLSLSREESSSSTVSSESPQSSNITLLRSSGEQDHNCGANTLFRCGHYLQQYELQTRVSNSLFPYYGNSDPFGSQAIDIDAQATYYLEIGSYSIDNILLGTGLWAHSPPRGAVAVKRTAPLDNKVPLSERLFGQIPADVSNEIQGQWLHTLAYAVLANYAGILYHVTQSSEHLANATIYIAKSLAGLRRYIAQGCSHDRFKPESLIFRLLRAEMSVESLSNAVVHAIYLKKVIEESANSNEIDLPFVLHEIYVCNQLAFLSWTRPLFEPRWVENVFGSRWEPWTDPILDVAAFQDALVPYTNSEELTDLMTATKVLFLQTARSLARKQSAVEDNWWCLQSRSEWLQLSLFNVARAEEERIEALPVKESLRAPVLKQEEVMWASQAYTAGVHMKMYLALTTLLSIRYRTQDPMLNNQSISPVMRIILARMTAAYQKLDIASVGNFLLGHYKDAFLWVAFVAALVEHRNQAFSQKHDDSTYGSWYKVLVGMLQKDQIGNWPELRSRLERFPFNEEETPLPNPTWLDSAFALSWSW
jgi:hypothetical protein